MKRILSVIDIRKNINKKLVLAYILMLLPALIIPALLYYKKLSETVETVLAQDMYKMTQLINTNIETYINDAEKITSAPYYSKEMQETLKI